MNDNSPLVSRALNFAIESKVYSDKLECMKQFNQSNQFQRSSSSIGANIAEATRAASRRDFVNKLRIASKELSETQYWLKLFKASKDYPDTAELYKMSIEIEYMLNKSISTAIKNGRNK
jgi:four helix bundle protein